MGCSAFSSLVWLVVVQIERLVRPLDSVCKCRVPGGMLKFRLIEAPTLVMGA
jgi:hypothetical protein